MSIGLVARPIASRVPEPAAWVPVVTGETEEDSKL